MDVLQEIILMIDHIAIILWNVQVPKELLSTGIHTRLLFSTEPIMFDLMNIIVVYTYKIITLQVIYHVNNILKVLFIINTSST